MQPPNGPGSEFGIGSPESQLMPNVIERETLSDLIEICRERLAIEAGMAVTPGDSMGNLYAMISTMRTYGVKLPAREGLTNAQKQHLRRMMVLQHQLVDTERIEKSQHLVTSLRYRCQDEYEEFEHFGDDLAMTMPWLLAVRDLHDLLDRVTGETAE